MPRRCMVSPCIGHILNILEPTGGSSCTHLIRDPYGGQGSVVCWRPISQLPSHLEPIHQRRLTARLRPAKLETLEHLQPSVTRVIRV